jgi:hypothetical protein
MVNEQRDQSARATCRVPRSHSEIFQRMHCF